VIENLEIENLTVIQNATISGELVALEAEFKLIKLKCLFVGFILLTCSFTRRNNSIQ
jgi:hypothetical protein